MSTVVDVSEAGKQADEGRSSDPFDGDRIEVGESQLRAVSPSAWLEGVRTRLDSTASRLIYGRR